MVDHRNKRPCPILHRDVLEFDPSLGECVESVVSSYAHIGTGVKLPPSLPHNDVAGNYTLPAKLLQA